MICCANVFCGSITFNCQSRHARSEEHTSELQSLAYLVCRLLLEKKKWDKQYLCVSSVDRTTCKRRQIGKDAKSINFFFNDTATNEIYTLSLHDALPILSEPTR